MEDASFEIDDLSSASEQLDSEEFGDISELLDDFERYRDDTRTKSEDTKVSTKQRKTKDVNSRIPILKERLTMNDEKKAEKGSVVSTTSLVVSTSNTPVRMTNSANASESSNNEGAKRTEEKIDIETDSSGLRKKDMENKHSSMNPKVIHFGLEDHAEVENSGKNNIEFPSKELLVNSFEEDESVSAKESDLGPSAAESLRSSEDNAISKQEERKCQQAPGDINEQEIRTRSSNHQTELKFLLDIVLNSVENKQKEEHNNDIVSVINGGEVITEKEVMNEADSDQDVKENNLNGQKRVIRGKHFASDIAIPSLPVDSEVSYEKPLNNENDNGTKNDLRKDSALKCTNQSIDFYSTSSLEVNDGKSNKDHAKSKNNEENEGYDLNLGDSCDSCDACRCHEDVTTSSLILNALDSSDDHGKQNYDDNGKMKAMDLGDLQGRATLATSVPFHSDNEESDKIRGFEASFSTNEEKTVEHNWEKADSVQEMKDHKDVGISSDEVRGANNKLGTEVVDKEQEKSDLNDFKVHQVHENDKLVSFSVDGEGKNEKLCNGKSKMKELDSNEADINKTSCYKDEEIPSITIHENKRNCRSNDKNCKKFEEHLDLKEVECAASELNEVLSLSEDGERVLINCDTPNKNEEKTKTFDSNDKERSKDDIINSAGCVDKINECEQGVENNANQYETFVEHRFTNHKELITRTESMNEPLKCVRNLAANNESHNNTFDNEGDDRDIENSDDADTRTPSKMGVAAAQGIHKQKAENVFYDEEAKRLPGYEFDDSKIKSLKNPKCIKDKKEHDEGVVADCSRSCVRSEGTSEPGENFTLKKIPVPAQRRKSKTNAETSTVGSDQINADDGRRTSNGKEQIDGILSTEISPNKKGLQMRFENANLGNENPAIAEVRKGLDQLSNFERAQEDNDGVQKSLRDSVRREDTENNDPRGLTEDNVNQLIQQEAKSQTNEEDEEKLKRRERETRECYDSENYLLPQDVTAFDPPICSTPRYGEVPTVNASHAILDGKMEAFEGFPSEHQPDQNGKLELGSIENGSAGCDDSEDAATGSKTANRKNTQPRYCPKEDINPFTTRPTQNNGVGFKEDIAKEIGFEDVESIYAASLDEDLEIFSLKREMEMMSPEYEELDVCLQDVASLRSNEDSSGGTKEMLSNHNRIGVSNGIRQPPHHRKYHKTRPKRHQESFIKMPSGLNLDEKSSLSYDPDHLQLPCTIDTQTTAQPNDRRLLHDKPIKRKSAFVPVESSSVRKNDYYRKRNVDANSWQGLLRESESDRGCADHGDFQNQGDNSQDKTNKYYHKDFHPTNALNKSQTTINDNSSLTTTRHNKNHLRSEPTWNERSPCHQDFHVEYSNSKHESNLSSTSQIGTLHVITFPLSHGPGILIGGGSTNKTPGIYVKEVIEGGGAFQDGRLRPGDKLLTVNGYNFSIASLSQAKSVLRKLKQEPSERIANICFVRDSDNVVDDVDSIDQTVTLPFSFSETSYCEEIGAKDVRRGARYLREDLILPIPSSLMTSTPIGVDVALPGKIKSQESGFKHSFSSDKFQLNEGLLMIAPNTKVHFCQLESSLSFLGLELSQHQKYLLRNQVVVDSEGYVIYEDFAKAARSIYALDLSRDHWDYTCYPEQGLHSSTSLMSPLPDIIPRPSANGILALRREFDQLVTEKDQIKDEILNIKKRLNGKAKMLRSMEDELVEVRNNLKRVENRKVLLLKKEKELEKAQLRNSSKLQEYKTVISSLEHEIVKLKALKVPVTSQLVIKHALLSKQIENLVTRVREVERSNQNYQKVTQRLMAFVHKVHTILHDDQLDMTSSKDHTYQSVDHIPVPKSKDFERGDRRVENLRQVLSKEARRIISTVQGMLSHVPLPFGWEEAYAEKGQKFYIDHLSGVTTWRPPS